MSEPVEQAAETPETPQESAQEADQPKTYTEEEVKALRAEAAKYRTRLREEEQARKASMSEAERAVVEAEERGALRVRQEYGQRLAQTEFRAAAAARDPEYDVAKALKYVNLAAFLGEDGEPDARAIAAAVADLIPERGTSAPPSFDGGIRQSTSVGSSMNDMLRKAAGRA